jgi:hypothetical protein
MLSWRSARGDINAGDWGIHGSIWSVDGEEHLALLLGGGLVHFGAGESIVGELRDTPKRARSWSDALRRCPSLALAHLTDATEREKLLNFVRFLPKRSQ